MLQVFALPAVTSGEPGIQPRLHGAMLHLTELRSSMRTHAAPGFQRKRTIMAYFYLTAAIVAEVIGTSSLKASDGFSKLGPTLIVCAAFASAFFFLSLALRTIPVGVAYAIWSGIGTALIVLIAAAMFKQIPDLGAMIGIGLIIAGVVVINLGSSMTH